MNRYGNHGKIETLLGELLSIRNLNFVVYGAGKSLAHIIPDILVLKIVSSEIGTNSHVHNVSLWHNTCDAITKKLTWVPIASNGVIIVDTDFHKWVQSGLQSTINKVLLELC